MEEMGSKDGRIIDQTQQAIEAIKTNLNSCRIIVSACNVGELDEMALMPCHAFFQFHAADGRLNCQPHQRSADVFLGVPFNIASYALLTHMMAQVCDLKPGVFVHTLGTLTSTTTTSTKPLSKSHESRCLNPQTQPEHHRH